MSDLLEDIFSRLMENRFIRRGVFIALMALILYASETYSVMLGCWAFLIAVFGFAEITSRR